MLQSFIEIDPEIIIGNCDVVIGKIHEARSFKLKNAIELYRIRSSKGGLFRKARPCTLTDDEIMEKIQNQERAPWEDHISIGPYARYIDAGFEYAIALEKRIVTLKNLAEMAKFSKVKVNLTAADMKDLLW